MHRNPMLNIQQLENRQCPPTENTVQSFSPHPAPHSPFDSNTPGGGMYARIRGCFSIFVYSFIAVHKSKNHTLKCGFS